MKPYYMRALLAPAALVCVLTTRAVAAPADDPEQIIRTGTEQVLDLALDKSPAAQARPLSERVRPQLEKSFSFDAITRRSVGPRWRDFTPEQRQRTIELFTTRVIRTYADRFATTATERPAVTYGAVTQLAASPPRCEVPTTITYQGSKFAVTYRLEQMDGEWRIYDVVIEGVSMISNYRSQFDAVLQKGGADELLRMLATEPAGG